MNCSIRLMVGAAFCAGLVFLCACASTKTDSGTSSTETVPAVELSSSTDASVTGYYIAKGKRVELAGALPMTIRPPGLAEVAVRKVDSTGTLAVSARTRNGSVEQSVPSGRDEGIRVMLDSLSVSAIPPQESLTLPGNTLIVIAPYWYEGTWVFDDASKGLQREPFVGGVPEMINALVKKIPNARDGFRLICSTKPFPGFQKKLVWIRAEAGGNYYRFADKSMPGWLCPAMLRYFAKTPKVLYVKAEPRKL